MGDVFISYSHKDKAYAHALAKELERRGFTPWIDDRIDYGTRWPAVIQEHLDSCDALVLIVSDASYESEWVQNEVTRAKRKGKPIFPLLLSGEQWLSIETTQYVDVRGAALPPDAFFEQLAIRTQPYSDEFDHRLYNSLTSEWPAYVNEKHGFSIRYPLEAHLGEADGETVIEFDRPEETNLLEKRIIVKCIEGDRCEGYVAERYGEQDYHSRVQVINGREFLWESVQGASLSKYYDVSAYSTYRSGVCIVIMLFLKIVSQGPYWPHLITQVDLESEKEVLTYVVSSFAAEPEPADHN